MHLLASQRLGGQEEVLRERSWRAQSWKWNWRKKRELLKYKKKRLEDWMKSRDCSEPRNLAAVLSGGMILPEAGQWPILAEGEVLVMCFNF